METKLGQKYRILIVDDEPGIRETLKEYLESPVYEIEMAGSGNAALEILKKQRFNFIISDIRMPDGDGIFLLDEIKSSEHSSTDVLLISGFSEISKDEIKKKGALDLLSKPIDYAIIEQIIKTKLI